MLYVIMFCCAFAGLAAIAAATRALWAGSIHYLPTLGWSCVMVLPFAAQYPFMYEATRDLQAFAILLFLGVIFITDHIAAKSIDASPHQGSSQSSLRLGYALGAIYIALTIFHLATAPSIPFAERFFNGVAKGITDEQRNAFSRGYDFIPGLKYAFTLALPLFGVPAILLLWRNRRYIFSVILFLWVVIYCIAGTAKAPLIMALLITYIGTLYLSEGRLRLILARGLLGLAVISLITGAIITTGPAERYTVLSDLKGKYAHPQLLREDHKMLLGDYVRGRDGIRLPGYCDGKICNYIDYLAYRIILTPVEVSARWYEYFTLYPVKDIRYSRMIEDSRSNSLIHPAQAVGLWGFHEPFPDGYHKSAYAYSSVDADAWGRYGLLGLALAALLYMTLRLATLWLHDTQTITRGIYYAVLVGLFTLLPASSSIQAMLIAHGMAPICAVLIGMRAWGKYTHLRNSRL